MTITRFVPQRELIFVEGKLWGPRRRSWRELKLVLDTGAAETVIVPEILDEIGYSPLLGEAITTMRSAVGAEQGYLIRVARLDCLRHQQRDLRVHAHDLPEEWNIHGLLGLGFLHQFNYQVRSAEGRILVERTVR